jgi:hypothetical protein
MFLALAAALADNPMEEFYASRMRPLSAPYLKPGYKLVYGPDLEFGFTMPVMMTAYLVTPTKSYRPYRGMDTLKGDVDIEDEKSALAYVRLRTAPATAQWFTLINGKWQESLYEVIAREDADDSLTDGTKEMQLQIYFTHDGEMGFVSRKRLQLLGYQKPEITKTPNGFHIRRWVVASDEKIGGLGRSEEDVTTDGAYSFKFVKSKHQPQIEWQPPTPRE